MAKLRYSPEARSDLAEIKEYIGVSLENPGAASRMVTRIAKQIRELERFPEIGTPLSAIADIETNYRFIVCRGYLVFYRFEQNRVYIIRVLHGRRNYLAILFGEPQEDKAE
jgi:plasmid stabilization system protein ParE